MHQEVAKGGPTILELPIDIWEIVFSYLTLQDLLCLRATCKHLQGVVAGFPFPSDEFFSYTARFFAVFAPPVKWNKYVIDAVFAEKKVQYSGPLPLPVLSVEVDAQLPDSLDLTPCHTMNVLPSFVVDQASKRWIQTALAQAKSLRQLTVPASLLDVMPSFCAQLEHLTIRETTEALGESFPKSLHTLLLGSPRLQHLHLGNICGNHRSNLSQFFSEHPHLARNIRSVEIQDTFESDLLLKLPNLNRLSLRGRIDGIQLPPSITYLSCSQITGMALLTQITQLPHLQSIFIDGLATNAFRNEVLTYLVWLRVDDEFDWNARIRTTKGLPQLRHLYIRRKDAIDILDHLIATNTASQLSKLSVMGGTDALDENGIDISKQVASMPHLHSLNLASGYSVTNPQVWTHALARVRSLSVAQDTTYRCAPDMASWVYRIVLPNVSHQLEDFVLYLAVSDLEAYEREVEPALYAFLDRVIGIGSMRLIFPVMSPIDKTRQCTRHRRYGKNNLIETEVLDKVVRVTLIYPDESSCAQ